MTTTLDDGAYTFPVAAEPGRYTVFAANSTEGTFGKTTFIVDKADLSVDTIQLKAGPGILGPTVLTLNEGYAATQTPAYTLYVGNTAAVTLNPSDYFTWNAAATTLTVQPGLTALKGDTTYEVVVTVTEGGVSDSLTLAVTVKPYTQAPQIDYPVEDEIVSCYAGQETQLTIVADRVSQYTWYMRATPTDPFVPVPNANAATLTLPFSESLHGHQYYCKAENHAGYVASAMYTLQSQTRMIVEPTEDQVVYFTPGQSVEMRVTASRPVRYQWYQWLVESNGGYWQPIEGAISSSLTLSQTTADMDGDSYFCAVSDPAGLSDYEVAYFFLHAKPVPPAADVPATGDAGSPGLWLALLGLSLAGLGGAVWRSKRASKAKKNNA